MTSWPPEPAPSGILGSGLGSRRQRAWACLAWEEGGAAMDIIEHRRVSPCVRPVSTSGGIVGKGDRMAVSRLRSLLLSAMSPPIVHIELQGASGSSKANIPGTQTVEVRVNRTGRRRRLLYHSRGHNWRFLLRWTIYCAILVSPCAASFTR